MEVFGCCFVLAVQLEEGVGQGQLDPAVPHQKSNHVIDGKRQGWKEEVIVIMINELLLFFVLFFIFVEK